MKPITKEQALFGFLFATGIISFFIDNQVSSILNSSLPHWINTVSAVLSHPAFLIIIALILPALLLLKQKRRDVAVRLGASYLTAYAATLIIKALISRPRPYDANSDAFFIINTFSFPSGHAALAFSTIPIIAAVLIRYRPYAIILAVGIALSRVFLGMHYVSDIVFGALIGLIIGSIWNYEQKNKQQHLELQFELRRKVVHVLLGFAIVCLIYYNWYPLSVIGIVLIISLILFSIENFKKMPLITYLIRTFERTQYQNKETARGLITYLLGCGITILIFPKSIAMAAIMILAVGDATSRIISNFGTSAHPFSDHKYFEGYLAGILTSFIFALFFVNPILAIIGSIVGLTIESLTIKMRGLHLDDNLLMPIASGITMYTFSLMF